MTAGETLFKAVKARFFSNFRVSVMLDSNGSDATAATGLRCSPKLSRSPAKSRCMLAGTGPVGMRAAAMLHIEGAEVVASRRAGGGREQGHQRSLRPCAGAPSRPSTIKTARRSRARRSCSAAAATPLLDETGRTTRRSNFWPTVTRSRHSASAASRPSTGRKTSRRS